MDTELRQQQVPWNVGFCAQRGHEPRSRVAAMTGANPQTTTTLTQSQERIAYLQAVAENMQRIAAEAAAKAFDAARTPVSLAVGDKVLVHYISRENKLESHWRGPYTVTAK